MCMTMNVMIDKHFSLELAYYFHTACKLYTFIHFISTYYDK